VYPQGVRTIELITTLKCCFEVMRCAEKGGGLIDYALFRIPEKG